MTMRGLAMRMIGYRPARFVAVGILNTLFGYLIYLLGLVAGLRPELALALATLVGACFNYVSTGRLVFAHAGIDRLPRFLAAYAGIYAVNALALRHLLDLGVRPALAQAFLVPLFAVISYLVFKKLVFGQRKAP